MRTSLVDWEGRVMCWDSSTTLLVITCKPLLRFPLIAQSNLFLKCLKTQTHGMLWSLHGSQSASCRVRPLAINKKALSKKDLIGRHTVLGEWCCLWDRVLCDTSPGLNTPVSPTHRCPGYLEKAALSLLHFCLSSCCWI